MSQCGQRGALISARLGPSEATCGLASGGRTSRVPSMLREQRPAFPAIPMALTTFRVQPEFQLCR